MLGLAAPLGCLDLDKYVPESGGDAGGAVSTTGTSDDAAESNHTDKPSGADNEPSGAENETV
jgi:hypothetical protein